MARLEALWGSSHWKTEDKMSAAKAASFSSDSSKVQCVILGDIRRKDTY